jgi:SH3 domain protein
MKTLWALLIACLVCSAPVSAAEDEITAIEAAATTVNLDQLLSRFEQLQLDYRELQNLYFQEQAARDGLAEELAGIKLTAASAISIANERNELRLQVTDLLHDIADLRQLNRDYENDRSQRWFLIGALVLFLGVVLGVVAPNIRLGQRRNKSANWNKL